MLTVDLGSQVTEQSALLDLCRMARVNNCAITNSLVKQKNISFKEKIIIRGNKRLNSRLK